MGGDDVDRSVRSPIVAEQGSDSGESWSGNFPNEVRGNLIGYSFSVTSKLLQCILLILWFDFFLW